MGKGYDAIKCENEFKKIYNLVKKKRYESNYKRDK